MAEPTPQPQRAEWRANGPMSFVVRFAASAIPFALAFLAARAVAGLLGRPQGAALTFVWWTVVIATSLVTFSLADRLSTRLLPLTALFQLSLVFPDRAPSRFKVARNAGNLTYLRAQVARLSRGDRTIDANEAAEIVLSLVASLSRHDRRTRGHSERTRVYTDMIVEGLNLPRDARDRLRWAALLHDIGKLEVAAEILNKAGKPDPDEWAALKRHPSNGGTLIEPLKPWLGEWAHAVDEHHERYDGTGYPHALSGEGISLAGRIVAVADAFETMTASRAYKRPMSIEAARQELVRCAGTHFDPTVVRAFIRVSVGRRPWLAGVLSSLFHAPAIAKAQALSVNSFVGTALAAGGAFAAPALPATDFPPPATASIALTQGAPTEASLFLYTPLGDDERPVARPDPEPRPAPRPTPPPSDEHEGPPATGDPQEDPDGGSDPIQPIPVVSKAVDDVGVVLEDGLLVVDVSDNDEGVLAEPGSVSIVAHPSKGTALVLASGNIKYLPLANLSGSDEIIYRACRDGLCDKAAISISIVPVNDRPIAVADSVSVSGGSLTIDVLANDSDVDGDQLKVSWSPVKSARGGTVTCTLLGMCVYVPKAGFIGSDWFKYHISDGELEEVGRVDIVVGGGGGASLPAPAPLGGG